MDGVGQVFMNLLVANAAPEMYVFTTPLHRILSCRSNSIEIPHVGSKQFPYDNVSC
jgi:hypothetical protein